MKYARPIILLSLLFLLCACSTFNAGKPAPAPAPAVQASKPLAVPVGKNWQIIEEAPKLSNDQGRLPFQSEQSVQPPGAQPLTPTEKRNIETVR